VSPRRRSTSDGPHPGTVALGRALVLVVVAVIIGAIVLHKSAPTTSGASTPVATTASTAPPTGVTTTTAPSSHTATSGTARPPSQVLTLVANGTRTSGAGARVSAALQRAGYDVLPATNSNASANSSAIYYTAGYDREAVAVAGVLGLGPSTVQPVPTQSPVANPHNAKVIVVVGPDLARQGSGGSSSSSP
jgi:LytR cell envelope-related transcriptional attenuator